MLKHSQIESGRKQENAGSKILRGVVCIAILALVASLAGKTVSLQCGQTTIVQSDSEAAKHPKFERSGPQWSVPVRAYVLSVDRVEATQVPLSTESPISFQFDESLYIRPPPVV